VIRLGRSLVNAFVAIIVSVGVIVAASGLWFQNAVYKDRALPAKSMTVIIARGSSFGAVTTQLAQSGVIAHPIAFRILARLRQEEANVKAGEYTIEPNQSSDEVLRTITAGTGQVARWVTFPEGYTAREIAASLAEKKFGSQDAFARAFSAESIDLDGTRTTGLEGYLFPSTYLMPVDVTPRAAAKILVDQFRKELPTDARERARRLGLNVPQVVTIASLVEREAKADDERSLMAGVYYNRLRRGMPLEVDATIEYVFASHHDVITRKDLQIDSPYNTYRYPGLPPTPIANPGKASLDAAFSPRSSEFLYYVYKGDGHSAFARTLQEHNANVSRYLK